MSGIHSIYDYVLNGISFEVCIPHRFREEGAVEYFKYWAFSLTIGVIETHRKKMRECSNLVPGFDVGSRVQSQGLSKGRPRGFVSSIGTRIDSGLYGNIREGCLFGLGGTTPFNP